MAIQSGKLSTHQPPVTIVFNFDRASKHPLHRQLYEHIRDLILSGRLPPRTFLPPTRVLASDLGCSRNTILNAFDQLTAEGFIIAQQGSGTAVAPSLPTELLNRNTFGKGDNGAIPSAPVREAQLSRFGESLATADRYDPTSLSVFNPGRPEASVFPVDIWTSIFSRIWRNPAHDLLNAKDPAGYRPLRVAISDHLRQSRGIVCDPDQIIVTSGTSNSFDLLCRLLLNPDDRVWVENPGYFRIQTAVRGVGARLVPLGVDEEGLLVSEGLRQAPHARMVIVTPSHHFPTGVVMSATRRLKLLDWAAANDAWIVEDDYNSEFRHEGSPLSALQSLDDSDRVIYLGTFSKVIFPNLRLGFIVAPPSLAPRLARARLFLDSHTSFQLQPVLAAFIRDGHLAKHIWRMRRIYGRRRLAFLDAAGRHLSSLLHVAPNAAGYHMLGYLTPELAARMSDREASLRSQEAGIGAQALSNCYLGDADRQGLILGFASIAEGEADRHAEKLAAVLSV